LSLFQQPATLDEDDEDDEDEEEIGTMTSTDNSCRRSVASLGLATLVTLAAIASPAGVSAGQGAPNDQVTFTRDIAPILQRSCQRCHRPDSLAPMSLITYEEVRPYARAIKQRTAIRNKQGVMPPWYIEKNIGIQHYKDDFSLSEDEIAKFAKWADTGASRGNSADLPPPLTFADAAAWQIGKPDVIVSSRTIEVKSSAADWWGRLEESATGLTEDRYVSAVEIKEVNDSRGKVGRATVGGLFVVHHAVFNVVGADGRPDQRGGSGGWPVHEVGRNAQVFPPDAGRPLRAGSKLVFPSVHVHSNGKDTQAHLEIGFKFHPVGYEPKVAFRDLFVGIGPDIDLKGNEANQRMDAYFTLPQNVKLSTFEPHMHASGVRMCLEAVWGITVHTLSCAGYDHSWVRVYVYDDDAAPLLPKGTILHVIGYFDTTPANRNVVDPRNWSGSGHRSIDNMFINLSQSIFLTDEQFQQELASRREKLHLTEGQTVIGCPLCGVKAPARPAGNP